MDLLLEQSVILQLALNQLRVGTLAENNVERSGRQTSMHT